jgi:hypothetical protein
MVEASVSGLFRMILLIIGVFVVVRFIGQVIVAKNNVARDREMRNREEALAKEKLKAKQNAGKTKIIRDKKSLKSDEQIIDVDFTDVKD